MLSWRNSGALPICRCGGAGIVTPQWERFLQRHYHVVRYNGRRAPQRFHCMFWKTLPFLFFVWVHPHEKMVFRKMKADRCSEILSIAGNETACIDAILGSKKIRGKVRRCILNEPSCQKRNTGICFLPHSDIVSCTRAIYHTPERKSCRRKMK